MLHREEVPGLNSRPFNFSDYRTPGSSLLRRALWPLVALLALGAVTAFGVAPNTVVELPDFRYVVRPFNPTAQTLHPAETDPAPVIFRQSERVLRGDSLGSIVSRLGADDPEFLRFATTDRTARPLLQLAAGRTVLAEVDELGRIHRLQYRPASLDPLAGTLPSRLVVTREGEAFRISEEPIELERSTVMRTAEVRSSLFAATDAADIPDAIAIKLVDVLDGAVNMRRDLRRGDTLRVVYEVVREAGTLDHPLPGRLLGFEFINDGTRHQAVWFEHESGKGSYFDFEGKSLTRTFLREPLEFSRISSNYSFARRHPLFRNVRAHTGVDFAAPTGTRVRSSADGVVEFAGYDGGYGNVVRITHPGRITTVYAHLSSFADGLKRGHRVSQGEVIGRVGMTGWATGPHLHYEFRIDGRHTDPMTVPLPEGPRLTSADRLRFDPVAAMLREQIAQLESVNLARFE
jgi:murein DD-endopeptidase MepM/ murein hydrolase activator NlpD